MQFKLKLFIYKGSTDLLNRKDEVSQNTSKMQIVANTKQMLGQRLRSFRQLGANNNASNQTEDANKASDSATNNVTHLASAITLIDYYNTVSELMPSNVNKEYFFKILMY